MDNVTHGLIGYALARATTRDRSAAEQRAGSYASIAASNAPDLDFFVNFFSDHQKLNYLAHHRGHTHTLLFAVPIGIACAEIFLRVFRVVEPGARVRLHALAVLAALLHIAFDWLNNYGVHPFFPFDNRWYYGDAIFIVEPMFFAALLPLVIRSGLTRAGRITGYVIALAVLAIAWGVALVPVACAVLATLAMALGLALHALGAHLQPRAVAWHALGGLLAVVLLFGAARGVADKSMRQYLSVHAHGEHIAQLALAPLPSHPLCWTAVAVTTHPGGTYRGRFGYASLWPAVVDPATCDVAPRGPTTAPLAPSGLEARRGVAFDVAFAGKLADLRALARTSCEARVFLQFARAPFWIEGPPTILGDLRYDHEPELQFAELEPAAACRDGSVPWVPPLQSLLR